MFAREYVRRLAPAHSITADTALRLGKFFGMEAQFWMNLQSHYDLEVAKDAIAGKLAREVEVLKAA